MGACDVIFKEVRFIIEDELTYCFVRVDAIGDCPHTVQGWHSRTFPASLNCIQILESMAEENPILWPRQAPK